MYLKNFFADVELIEIYSTAVTASHSHFCSQNPMLRRNVVILLAEILNYTQITNMEMVAEAIISDIITGTVGLQKDQDKIVWTVATEQLCIYHCQHEDIGSVHQRIFLIVDR